jgi:TetR/AcrR family transcriptional regulator
LIQSTSSTQTDTKSHITQIATKMFAERGFHGTSIREIAEVAGITKPVLYYYFKNKEQLYATLIENAYVYMLGNLEEILAEEISFEEKFSKVVHLYFYHMRADSNSFRLIFGAFFGPRENAPNTAIFELEDRHMQLVTRLMTEGVQVRRIKNYDHHTLAMHFLGPITVYIMSYLLEDNDISQEHEQSIVQLILNGIGSETL